MAADEEITGLTQPQDGEQDAQAGGAETEDAPQVAAPIPGASEEQTAAPEVAPEQVAPSPPPQGGETGVAAPVPPASVTEDPEANIQRYLQDADWVAANPGLAKQFRGIQRHLTQKSQEYSEAIKQAEARERELEATKAALLEFDPRNPGERAIKFTNEMYEHAQREEAATFDEDKFQRLVDEEGEEAGRMYRLETTMKRLELDNENLKARFDAQQEELRKRDERDRILREEGEVLAKAKQAGLTEEEAQYANIFYGGMRDRGYKPDIVKAIALVKALSKKGKAPTTEAADRVARAKANAGRAPRAEGGTLAAKGGEKPKMFNPDGTPNPDYADQVVAHMRSRGLGA